MALTRLLLCLAAVSGLAVPAGAQAPTVELSTTAGYSTQGTRALSTQVRIFGEAGGGVRYFIEGVGNVRGGPVSDAFQTAYPYDPGAFLMEAYAEDNLRMGPYVAGARAGRFRLPFGIYGRSDQSYNGFLRAPLIRSYNSFGLTNFWLEEGGDVFFGTQHVQVEASAGSPSDPVLPRRDGLDRTVRLQVYEGPFILGASYAHTQPTAAYSFARGAAEFHGVDARWMQNGLQLRGEWISAVPFFSASTEGWYVDAFLHRPWMNRTTAVLRYEELDYDRAPFSFQLRRITAGAKVDLTRNLFAQINLIQQRNLTPRTDTALDFGLTYTVRK